MVVNHNISYFPCFIVFHYCGIVIAMDSGGYNILIILVCMSEEDPEQGHPLPRNFPFQLVNGFIEYH